MKYKLLIFDMDGTILDTLEDLADSLNVILEQEGLPTHSYEKIRSIVGNGIHREIELSVPEGSSEEVIERVFNAYVPYYASHCAIKTKPYDGIIETIKRLREMGYKTAVVSNKKDVAVRELCDVYFKDCFDVFMGEKEGIRRKPDPDLVNEVLETLQIAREDSVYIGDSEVDVATGKNAGMDMIAVTWGFRERELLIEKGAVTLIDKPEELINYV